VSHLAAMEVPAEKNHTPFGRSEMRKWLVSTVLAVALTATAQPRMTVRVYNMAQVPEGILKEALAAGDTILRQAGVASEWVTEAGASCEAATFTIRILRGGSRVPGEPNAFGAAMVTKNGDRINKADAFYGRVLEYSTSRRETAWLLANVMAHEICHLLLGGQHYSRGLMRASWDKQDMKVALVMPLKLDEAEKVSLRQAASQLNCQVLH
jgi:hypothetical protein